MLHPENASRLETPTTDVIFQDRKKRELFGELLHHNGRQDLIDAYMNNPSDMSDADQEALKRFREDFGRKYAFAQEAAAHVNKEDIAYMLANNNFGLFGQSIEAGRAAQMIKDYVYMLFMREEDDMVQDLIFAQRQLREIRESAEYARTKDRVGEYLKRNKMTPDEMDTAAKELKGRPMVHNMLRAGFLDRILGDGQMKRSTAMLHEIQDHLETIGSILAASVSKDKSFVNDAVREAISGKKAPEVGHTEPTGHTDMESEQQATKTEFNADALRSEIKNPDSAFRKGFQAKVGKKWEDASPNEREEAFFSSYENRASQKNSRRGLFGSFLASLFRMLLSRRKTELKKEFES